MDQIILHHVDNSSDWPAAVQSISRELNQPLPASCALRDNCATGIPTHQASGNDAHEHVGQALESYATVDDILDTVLATVKKIRAVATLNRHAERLHPTSTFWLPLLSDLGHMCSGHASVISDTSFILPRSDETRFDFLGGIRNGNAHLLISYIVDPELLEVDEATEEGGLALDGEECEASEREESEASKESASTDSGARSTTCDESSGDVSDFNCLESFSAGSTASSASGTRPLPVPFCAHVVSGCGARTYAVLPIISVAEEGEIEALLSSVLYQRYVWGIQVPAVGISLSTTGTITHIILGWIDRLPSVAGRLPTIHLASAPSHYSADPSLGIYDLEDSSSALCLSQFILSLTSHFTEIIDAVSSPRMSPLPWRSDHIFIDELMPNEADGFEEFYQLPQWIRMSTSSGDSSTYPRTPSTHDFSTLPVIPPATSKSVPCLPTPVRSGTTTSSDNVIHSPFLAVARKTRSEENQSLAVKPVKALSTVYREQTEKSRSQHWSSFAARHVTDDLTGRATFATWLLERGVVRVAHHQFRRFRTFPEAKRAINKKVQFYDAITAFPVVDMDLMAAYQPPAHLATWHDRLRSEYAATLAISQGSVELETDLQSLLKSRLHSILHASSYTGQLTETMQGGASYENKSRHAWDGLLYCFALTEDNVASQHVLLKQVFDLPRNDGFDSINANQCLLENYQAIADIDMSLCRGVSLDLGLGQRTPSRQELDRARFEACDNQTALETITEDALVAAVQEHFTDEPRLAEADACITSRAFLPALPEHSFEPQFKASVHDDSQGSPTDQEVPCVPDQTTSSSNPVHKAIAVARPRIPGCIQMLTGEDCIDVAVLVAQYEKAGTPAHQAFHQACMCCVASTVFMRSLGLSDIAVFGLVVRGTIGQLIMCWNDPPVDKSVNSTVEGDDPEFCDPRDQIYLLAKNVKRFDISDPVQCLHFAVILLRLAKHGHEITDKIMRAEDAGDAEARFFAIGGGQLHRWTMEAQLAEVKPEVKASDVKTPDSAHYMAVTASQS